MLSSASPDGAAPPAETSGRRSVRKSAAKKSASPSTGDALSTRTTSGAALGAGACAPAGAAVLPAGATAPPGAGAGTGSTAPAEPQTSAEASRDRQESRKGPTKSKHIYPHVPGGSGSDEKNRSTSYQTFRP